MTAQTAISLSRPGLNQQAPRPSPRRGEIFLRALLFVFALARELARHFLRSELRGPDLPSRFDPPIPDARIPRPIGIRRRAGVDLHAPGVIQLADRVFARFEDEIVNIVVRRRFRFLVIGDKGGVHLREQVRRPRDFPVLQFNHEDVARAPFDIQGNQDDGTVRGPFGTKTTVILVSEIGPFRFQSGQDRERLERDDGISLLPSLPPDLPRDTSPQISCPGETVFRAIR